MGKFIDITGKKFGQITVVKRDPEKHITPSGKKLVYWICECNCKTIISILGDHLRREKTTKCKKCKYKSMRLNGYISSTLYSRIKYRAKIGNIYFDKKITREYLWKIYLKQNKKCSLSGMDIIFADTIRGQASNKETTASLDRIDSKKGYLKNNIQWVHKDINKIKGSLTTKEFLKRCELIRAHNETK